MTPPLLATTKASAFRLECSVRRDLAATPSRIWALRTDAVDLTREAEGGRSS